jgi:hypothetical protein
MEKRQVYIVKIAKKALRGYLKSAADVHATAAGLGAQPSKLRFSGCIGEREKSRE